ncbi:unnamed protein product [Cochlearia groenlandica]
MENLFVQIFDRKRRIVEQVKQHADLHDQNQASKCLLAGVTPPPWLWSPSMSSQTSELNKEEIISGLLCPPNSRASIICPSSHPYSYQRPVSFLADSVVRQDLASVVTNPLKEQLLEEGQQRDLSDNSVRYVSNHSDQKEADIASPRDVQEEVLPENVSICCLENQSCVSPKYSQNHRVGTSLDGTSPQCIQGVTVPKSASASCCEQKPLSPGYCPDEAEPNTCFDPGFPVARILRSKSRQKDFDLRSSAKARKSRSNSINELKPSPVGNGNIGFGISSLRSDSVSEINLFKHEEKDVGCREEENCKSQGEGGDHCIKVSSTTESPTPHQKGVSVQKSSSRIDHASIVPELTFDSGHVKEMDILQSIETIDEMSAKVYEQVGEPQSRIFNETADLDVGTRSKSLSQDSSKRKHPQSRSCNETSSLDGGTGFKSSGEYSSKRKRLKSSNSFSGNFPLRNSNPSQCADHEVELSQVTTMPDEVSMLADAGTSNFQSEIITRLGSSGLGNRSKTEQSGSVECPSIDEKSRDSISLLQVGLVKESLNPSTLDDEGGHVKETLNPSTLDVGGLVFENITSEDQSKEKSECVDPNRCSGAEKVTQTGISTDETTYACIIQDSISKADPVGFAEFPSVELQSQHSVMQSLDESVLLKPVTVAGEPLLVEDNRNAEPIEVTSISKSKSLSQTDVTVVEPVVVESDLHENCTPGNFIDHCKRYNISCGPMEVQPLGSLTRAVSKQCHGRSGPRNSAIEEESINDYKALSAGSDHTLADKQLEVRSGSSSLRTNNFPVFVKPESPHFDDNEERNFDEIPKNSQEKSTMEKASTPASSARVFHVPYLTESDINLSDTEMKGTEDCSGLKTEMVLETESHASHTASKARENEPTESNTFTGHIGTMAKRPQLETVSVKGVSPISRSEICSETREYYGLESFIPEVSVSSSSRGSSELQNKQRALEKLTSGIPSSSPGRDILDSDYVRETVHLMEEVTCPNPDNYNDELQKIIESASSDRYAVELEKMMGSASSDELRECYLLKEAGLKSPALRSFKPEQLSVQSSQNAPDHKIGSENANFFPCAGENSHSVASCVVRGSDSSPVLEGFIIQTDDENQSGSKVNHGNFQLPRTSAESAAIMEQICKSACMNTPSLQLAKTFKFAGKLDLDQSVSTELLNGMYFSQNLEGSSVFENLGIDHDYTRRSYTDCLPGSSADSKNRCTSSAEKLWYTKLQKSSSGEKRVSETPDLPCISEESENSDEEDENISSDTLKSLSSEKRVRETPDLPSISEESENSDEEDDNLSTDTVKSLSSEKRGSSIPDLPCIAEENENIDEMSKAVSETLDTEKENVSAEGKPLGDDNEDPMKFIPTVSDARIHVDRQSLDSVDTAFSFSAKCESVGSRVRKHNVGMQRFTGGGRNGKPPNSRASKPKLSCNSSLRSRLPDKEPRSNNIVSNITSFVPLVQRQKPPAQLFTGKRDVKVKALEAAEASKRLAEQKENDRKIKKEAMKLERATREQENLRKQEMEKKKKEEDRKKKEAEMAWKQEMEKKKKEEERKRKGFEMADRKRQREDEDKKLKDAKRLRIAEIQRQQKDADHKLQAEKELKRQAMDAKIKAQKELKEDKGKANTRIPEMRPKSNSSDDTNASRNFRDDDFKVISNQGKMSEESYDMSPFKCSDDEEEDDDDDNVSNRKFVPTWASKSNILDAVISQLDIDPYMIFAPESFCDCKVLVPQKFHLR